MFAVQEIIRGKLYAAEIHNGSDILTECFKAWQNPLYIRDYLKKQPSTELFFGVGLKEATKHILKESKKFYTDILNIAEGHIPHKTLDEYIFKPLHQNDDLNVKHVSTKAYGTEGSKSYLRLYAIRLSDGCYIVVGGLIKMHHSLQDSDEGRQILATLKQWANYLRKNNIDDAFDIGILIAE